MLSEIPAPNLREWFGGIDIYLFDQLLKERIVPGLRILDAGCGSGRNLVYFFRAGYEVFAIDESSEALAQTRRMAAELAPHLSQDNFREEPVERRWLIAVLLIEAVQVEPQVAFLDAANDQLKRLRPFLDRPTRAKRGQALQHVVLEVVGIHRRLLAHCGCNEVPKVGLQAVAWVSHAA